MDSNGYNKSILKTHNGRCYLCTRYSDTARHEVYFGSNRKISKREGFWVYVCPECHQYAPFAIHRNPLTGYDLMLKQECQREYEKTHTREKFIGLIGKSYL